MQRSVRSSVETCVAAVFGLLLGCDEASGQVVASCPVTVPTRNLLPKGAALLGSAPARTKLFHSTVTRDTPDAVKAHGTAQAEVESDTEDVGRLSRTGIWFDTVDRPHTLVCHYGKFLYPARGTAMLLVPLPPRMTGECIVTSELRPKRGKSKPMTSVCSRVKS